MRRRLPRIIAWLVTAALLSWVFSRIHFAEVWAAVGSASPLMAPVALSALCLVYTADSFAIYKIFGWFVAPLSLAETFAVRGASYLLALINYTVGQGAIVFFVHRSKGVPLARGAATVLLVMGSNLLVLLTLTTAGLLLAPDVPPALRQVVIAAYAGLAVYAAIVAVRPKFLASRPVFDVLLGAGIDGHLRAMLVRLPHTASLMLFTYWTLRAFGVAVPFPQALVTLPVVYFIAVLPISVQGLGTSQAAMVFFFARYAPGGTTASREAIVLAASLVGHAISVAFAVCVGLVCMRHPAARALAATSAAAPRPASGADGS